MLGDPQVVSMHPTKLARCGTRRGDIELVSVSSYLKGMSDRHIGKIACCRLGRPLPGYTPEPLFELGLSPARDDVHYVCGVLQRNATIDENLSTRVTFRGNIFAISRTAQGAQPSNTRSLV